MSTDPSSTEAPAIHEAEGFAPEAGAYDDDGGQPGMGQSKSSRRRRRKRKSKSDGGDADTGTAAGSTLPADQGHTDHAQGEFAPGDSGHTEQTQHAPQEAGGQANSQNSGQAGGQNSGQISMQANGNGQFANGASGQPGSFRPASGGPRSFNNAPQQSGQQQNGQQPNTPGGTKRWKKKFRERERPRPGETGVSFQAGASNGQSHHGGGYAQQGGHTQSGYAQAGQAQGGHSQAGSPQGGQGFQNNGFRGPDTHQPGNNAFKRKGGGGGFGKQRSGGGGGSRGGFVGPMDHSYRPANGNVFDASPTMENSGGGRGRSFHSADSQPIDYSQGRVIPIKEGTPTHIYFFIEDLFFTAKISETARKLGVKIAFIKNEKEQIAALTSGQETDRPGLIVFDLNNANAKPLTLIPKLKTKLKKTTSIIGFLSHLQGDLKAKAVEAGCDTVMPRAAFSQNLPNLLRRYGLEEIEETNFNQ